MSQLETSVSCAEKRYKINAKTSPLYALPYEVLAHIRGYLDPTEKTCFALSGAKFFETFPSITVPEDKVGDTKIGVYLRLLRDDFYREAHKRPGIWCVYCADVHKDTHFTESMLCRPRQERKCSSTLRLCPHRSYSLDYLRDKVERAVSLRGRQAMYFSLRCYTCETELKKSQIYFTNCAVTYDKTSGDYVMGSDITIGFSKAKGSGLHTEARRVLQKLDFTACLHRQISEESTINRFVDAETGAVKAEKQDQAHRVHCEHCKTMVRTKYVKSLCFSPHKPGAAAAETGLKIDIIRHLGKLSNEDDPTWRAHLRKRQLKVTKD